MDIKRVSLALNEKRDQVRLIEVGSEGEVINNVNITEEFMQVVFMAFANENGEPKRLVNNEGNGFEITVKVIKKNEIKEKKAKLVLN